MNGCRAAITRIKSQFPVKNLINSPYLVRCLSLTSVKNMKIVQFTYSNKPEEIKVGFLDKGNVVDIGKLDSSVSTTLLGVLKNGELEKVKKLTAADNATVPLSDVKIKAPIHGMDKVLCVGLNYKDHCAEQKLTPPEVPMFFNKFPSCIIGHDEAVRLRTEVTQKVDWEVEMVLVVGKTASSVKAADAKNYLAGITLAQDISARDWQKERNAGQFLLGKAMDGFCPIGPCVTTLDELGDPEKLDISCKVNGELKQTSNTNQLVHKVANILERITSVMTLLPGDLILTGTPGGVGMYRDPPQYLQPGDVITSELQGVGILTTKVEKF